MRFRHYDPTPGMCRWLERDLAGYQDGPSLYSSLGRNPMAGTDPTGQFANILGRAVVGAFIGGVAAAINGEDVLAGAAKGAVVGAVAGATFGAGLAAAGAVTASSVVAAGTVSGMAGARAAAVVYEGRAPAGQDLAWGGILGGVAAGILPAASRFGRFLGHSAIAGRRAPLARPITRPGTACFLAGTLVLNTTPDLAVPIESIAEGAVVASIYPAGTTCARIDGNTYTSTRRRIASERKIPKPDDAVQQHSADYRLPTQPRFRLMPSPKSSQARRRLTGVR